RLAGRQPAVRAHRPLAHRALVPALQVVVEGHGLQDSPRKPGLDVQSRLRSLSMSSAPLASCRVLVVDDQASIRSVLRAALADAGAEVEEAESGEAALQAVKAHAPQLVLLDLAMPGMNGWQVLEKLRSAPETAALPVILETSSGDFPSYEQARRHAV